MGASLWKKIGITTKIGNKSFLQSWENEMAMAGKIGENININQIVLTKNAVTNLVYSSRLYTCILLKALKILLCSNAHNLSN